MFDLKPLESVGFRHLAAAYWINQFGNWIGEIALTLLVYDRTHSPLATAGLFLAMQLAPAAAAPFLTVRVEALPTKAVVTFLYLVEALAFVALALLTRRFSMPIVCSLAALDGLLGITAASLTRGATASDLLGRGLLREGNAMLNLGAMAASASSPMLAGVLVASGGPEAALLVDAATFALAAAIIATAFAARVETGHPTGSTGNLSEATRFVWSHPLTRRLVVAIGFVAALNAVPVPVEVVFARQTLGAGASGYGFLLGAWGIGMLLGGTIFAAVSDVRLLGIVAVGTMLVACGYGAIALAPTLAVACAGSLVGGIGNGTAWGAVLTALQERIPIPSQSAVMSIVQGVIQVVPGLGFITGGVISAVASPRLAFAITALGIAVLVVVFTTVSALGAHEIELHGRRAPDLTLDSTPDTQEGSISDRSLPTSMVMIG